MSDAKQAGVASGEVERTARPPSSRHHRHKHRHRSKERQATSSAPARVQQSEPAPEQQPEVTGSVLELSKAVFRKNNKSNPLMRRRTPVRLTSTTSRTLKATI